MSTTVWRVLWDRLRSCFGCAPSLIRVVRPGVRQHHPSPLYLNVWRGMNHDRMLRYPRSVSERVPHETSVDRWPSSFEVSRVDADGSRLHEQAPGPYSLFVGDLAFDATSKDLEELFKECVASVIEGYIITDRTTGRSRGYGFVRIRDLVDAQVAVQSMNGHLFHGRRIRVSAAGPKRPSSKSSVPGASADSTAAPPLEAPSSVSGLSSVETHRVEYLAGVPVVLAGCDVLKASLTVRAKDAPLSALCSWLEQFGTILRVERLPSDDKIEIQFSSSAACSKVLSMNRSDPLRGSIQARSVSSPALELRGSMDLEEMGHAPSLFSRDLPGIHVGQAAWVSSSSVSTDTLYSSRPVLLSQRGLIPSVLPIEEETLL
jgi:hypothetical protein